MAVRRSVSALIAASAVTLAMVSAAAAAQGAAAAVRAVRAVPAVQVRHIRISSPPRQVAIDHQTRSVWVAAGKLVRISEVTNRVRASLTITPGVQLVAADPRTRTVWAAACAAACSVVEVRESTNHVVRRVRGFTEVSGISVDPRTGLVWIAGGREVQAISERTHRVVHVIHLHADDHHQLGGLSVNPRTGTVWVAVIPGDPGATGTWISEISEARSRVVHVWAPPVTTTTATAAFDSARGTAWLAFGPLPSMQASRVEVINIAQHRVIRTIFEAPVAASTLAIDPGARTVVAADFQGHVLLLRESSGRVRSSVLVGRYPGVLSVDAVTGDVYVPVAGPGRPAGFVAQFRL